jgi:hypothetical protein
MSERVNGWNAENISIRREQQRLVLDLQDKKTPLSIFFKYIMEYETNLCSYFLDWINLMMNEQSEGDLKSLKTNLMDLSEQSRDLKGQK